MGEKEKSQAYKFKEAARELKADESEANWEKRLKKVVKPKSGQSPPD